MAWVCWVAKRCNPTYAAKPIIIVNNDHIFTTSLLVAEKFDKKHYNVLRDIENIIEDCPDERFRKLNFEATIYEVPGPKNSVRQEKMYNLTRQGFTLLAMGFTGQKAFLWKIAFINAFDRMEQLLTQALVSEHDALLAALFAKHLQWQETVEATQAGMSTTELARRQGKAKSSARAMKARIRAAGIDLSPVGAALAAINAAKTPPTTAPQLH